MPSFKTNDISTKATSEQSLNTLLGGLLILNSENTHLNNLTIRIEIFIRVVFRMSQNRFRANTKFIAYWIRHFLNCHVPERT